MIQYSAEVQTALKKFYESQIHLTENHHIVSSDSEVGPHVIKNRVIETLGSSCGTTGTPKQLSLQTSLELVPSLQSHPSVGKNSGTTIGSLTNNQNRINFTKVELKNKLEK